MSLGALTKNRLFRTTRTRSRQFRAFINAKGHIKADGGLIDAHHAVNKITDLEAGTVKSVAWDHYVKAQGGPLSGRDCRIKMSMSEVPEDDTSSRYGEAAAARPLGVETSELQYYTPAHMAHTGGKAERIVVWVVESTRHIWTVTKAAVRSVLDRFSEIGATSRPWTRVNNCTESPLQGQDMEDLPTYEGWPGALQTYQEGNAALIRPAAPANPRDWQCHRPPP